MKKIRRLGIVLALGIFSACEQENNKNHDEITKVAKQIQAEVNKIENNVNINDIKNWLKEKDNDGNIRFEKIKNKNINEIINLWGKSQLLKDAKLHHIDHIEDEQLRIVLLKLIEEKDGDKIIEYLTFIQKQLAYKQNSKLTEDVHKFLKNFIWCDTITREKNIDFRFSNNCIITKIDQDKDAFTTYCKIIIAIRNVLNDTNYKIDFNQCSLKVKDLLTIDCLKNLDREFFNGGIKFFKSENGKIIFGIKTKEYAFDNDLFNIVINVLAFNKYLFESFDFKNFHISDIRVETTNDTNFFRCSINYNQTPTITVDLNYVIKFIKSISYNNITIEDKDSKKWLCFYDGSQKMLTLECTNVQTFLKTKELLNTLLFNKVVFKGNPISCSLNNDMITFNSSEFLSCKDEQLLDELIFLKSQDLVTVDEEITLKNENNAVCFAELKFVKVLNDATFLEYNSFINCDNEFDVLKKLAIFCNGKNFILGKENNETDKIRINSELYQLQDPSTPIT